MRPLTTDPRFQPQFQPLASPSLPPADVVDFRGYFKVETFGHGAVIYRPGLPADKVYLLRSGRVRLLRQGKGKSRSVLAILKPGDLFGEVLRPEGSLMEELAVSSGKCEVWSIEGRDFRALLEARPALAVDVIRALNDRVRQLRQRVLGLTRKDVPARLAEMLIALAQAHGERIAGKRALPARDHAAGSGRPGRGLALVRVDLDQQDEAGRSFGEPGPAARPPGRGGTEPRGCPREVTGGRWRSPIGRDSPPRPRRPPPSLFSRPRIPPSGSVKEEGPFASPASGPLC